MNSEECNIIGHWLSEWSNDKSEIVYLRKQIEEKNEAIKNIQETKGDLFGDYVKERDEAIRDLVKARKKLGAAAILMSDLFILLTDGKMTKSKVGVMIDRLREYQAKNNLVIIEDGMAK